MYQIFNLWDLEKGSKTRKVLFVIIALLIFVASISFFFASREKLAQKKQADYQNGLEKFVEGDFKEAIPLLEKTEEKLDPDVSFKLAVAHYNQKNYEAAINAYEKILKKNPKSSLAYNGIANVYRDQKNTEKATENYRKAIESNTSFALAYSNLAIMLMDAGEKDGAREIVEEGLINIPDSQELKNIEHLLSGN